MLTFLLFTSGVLVGVVYEKQIRKYKEAALRAAKAANNELHRH